MSVPRSLALLERAPERELIPMCSALGLSVAVCGALGSGLLSGKYRPNDTDIKTVGRLNDPMFAGCSMNERNFAIADEVTRVASEIGATPSQVALAWVRALALHHSDHRCQNRCAARRQPRLSERRAIGRTHGKTGKVERNRAWLAARISRR